MFFYLLCTELDTEYCLVFILWKYKTNVLEYSLLEHNESHGFEVIRISMSNNKPDLTYLSI